VPEVEWQMLKVGHCRQIERLSCHTAPWRLCNFPALAGLITHPSDGPILFDTGYSQRFFEATQWFPERSYRMMTPVTLPPHEHLPDQLARRGIAVADIRTIIISHFHGDHIAGLRDFPQATILCAREGLHTMRSVGRFAGVRRGLIPALLPDDFDSRARFVEDRPVIDLPAGLAPFERGYDLLGDKSIIAIPLPGHADGQFGILFTARDNRTVFLIADAAWSTDAVRHFVPPMQVAHQLVHHTSDYLVTLERLHSLQTRNPELMIVPSHCRQRQAELVA
jgi:glyoxylase-like metal-dependent hydrolase (beta-lactamase superfamily II)